MFIFQATLTEKFTDATQIFSYESTEKCFEELIKNRLIYTKDRMICPIEYINININDKYQHCSKCNHNFCNDSIRQWLNINNSCPM